MNLYNFLSCKNLVGKDKNKGVRNKILCFDSITVLNCNFKFDF